MKYKQSELRDRLQTTPGWRKLPPAWQELLRNYHDALADAIEAALALKEQNKQMAARDRRK